MLRRKHLIPAAIVVFWLIMLGLLLQREVFVKRGTPAATPTTAYETWLGVYTPAESGEESRIGYLRTLAAPETRDGVRGTTYGMTFKLKGSFLGKPTELTLNGRAWSIQGRGVSTFEFAIQTFEDSVMRAEGRVADESMELTVHTAGESFPVTLPVGRDVLLSGSMGSTTLNLPTLEVGEEVVVDSFDPVTLSMGKARVKCVGTETLEILGRDVDTKILTTTHGGITTKVWATADSEIVRIETPYGFILRKISREEALYDFDRSDVGGFIDRLAVQPAGEVPFRGAQQMTIELKNVPETMQIPSDNRQRVTNRTHLGIAAASAPDNGAPLEEGGVAVEDALAGDPFIQTGHPSIREVALRIVADESDPWQRARLIYQWVYDSIDKVIVLSIPSALDVLESRRGDCNEHSVLFAALARTVEIPTRIGVGLVWSETLGAFYYHAWPEVYVGQWVAMDPTLGQELADATHIKLIEGNIETWPRLVPFLGQVQIDVKQVQ